MCMPADKRILIGCPMCGIVHAKVGKNLKYGNVFTYFIIIR